MNRQAVIPEQDAYSEVVSAIQRTEDSMISVPKLSTLLGVKPTTLNARFRRENTSVRTIGRTNFISQDEALRLAELHKYALIGWLTLKHASELTGVKSGTIKAWCEADQVEGHIDLTKRIRIAPSALQSFRPIDTHRNKVGEHCQRLEVPVDACLTSKRRNAGAEGNRVRFCRRTTVEVEGPFPAAENLNLERAVGDGGRAPTANEPPVLSPAHVPEIRIMTRKDYGLPDIEESPKAKVDASTPSANKPKQKGPLSYDPDRPFSVSECAIGRRMRYGRYEGTILSIVDDPFNPHIQVAFPEHEHPLMREVLLVVGQKRR